VLLDALPLWLPRLSRESEPLKSQLITSWRLAAMVRAVTLAARYAATVAVRAATSLRMWLPQHPIAMDTTFRHCFLVNFSMPEDVLARALPRGLRPDLGPDGRWVSAAAVCESASRITHGTRLHTFAFAIEPRTHLCFVTFVTG
jgi:hypothetical protein